MRLHTLALTTVVASLASTSNAFAPIMQPTRTATHRSTSSSLSLQNSNFDSSIEQAKKGLFSIVAASTIFIASTGTVVEPAFAITSTTTPTTTTTTSTTSTIKKTTPAPAVIDPLASEKASVENAKSQLASATNEVTKAKKVLSDANTAYAKASDAVTAAKKKVTASKKALITANDKLADAKSKEGRNGGADLNVMKEVEGLAAKVGTFFLLLLFCFVICCIIIIIV